MRTLRALPALGLLVAAACTVEAPTLPDIGTGSVDGGPPDGGFPDGGFPDCVLDPTACAADEYCGPDAICRPRAGECTTSQACGPRDACLRPIVPTSTTTAPGACVRGCDADTDCGDGRCLTSGVCAPGTDVAGLFDLELRPLARCAAPSDCGLGGVCRDGFCDTCGRNADCPGALRCADGACVEPSRCATSAECFAGNQCVGGRCTRDVSGCEAEADNDNPDFATELEDGRYVELQICGDDQDWYRLTPPEGRGLEVVVTSTASAVGIDVQIETGTGGSPAAFSRLDLPGLTVLRVPNDNEGTTYALGVSARDVSGRYDLTVRYVPGLCADDPLGIYAPDDALLVPSNIAYEAVACVGRTDRVAFDVAAGDRLGARVAFGDDNPAAAPTAALVDEAGAVIEPGLDRTFATVATASTGALAGAGRVRLEAAAEQVASEGERYVARIERRLPGRAGACTSAPMIDPAAAPVVQGDLSAASDLGRPDCTEVSDTVQFSSPTRQDLLYRLVPPAEDSLLTVRARPTAGTSPRLSLALLSDCEDDGDVEACEAAAFPRGEPALSALVPAGAARFLVVSSDGPAEDVTVELSFGYASVAAFANDQCVDATPLLMSGTQDVLLFRSGAGDDERLFADEVSAACAANAGDGAGADRFYRLDLQAGERAAVELTGPIGGMLWTGRGCDDMPGTCTAAAVRSFSVPVARATFTASVSPETFFVVVDGARTPDDLAPDERAEWEGQYRLRTVRDAECLDDGDCQGAGFNLCGQAPCRCDDFACALAPANDRCNGAPIDLGPSRLGAATLQGSTGAANHDYVPTCISGTQPDVVYSLVVPEGAAELVARVTEATFDPALEIRRGTCVDGAGDVWCNDDARFPDVLLPEVRVSEPEAGTYYLVVDSFAGEGAFTLEVEVR